MSKRIFNQEQVDELLKNKNVARCSEKSITYDKDFKRTAVRQYNDHGLTSGEIFRQAGFDLGIIGEDTPKESLRRWNRVYQTKGLDGLVDSRGKNGGGGRPKIRDLNDADKIKRLETEVAYLKAENDFLAKLRASKKR